MPIEALAALVDWVEKGEAPEVHDAAIVDESNQKITRQLCKWPAKPVYMDIGDPKKASSWTCSTDTLESKTVYGRGGHGTKHDEQ